MPEHYGAGHPYAQQHDSGVHANCRPATQKTRTVNGTGSANACMLAMKNGPCVERWHSHGYEGPLVCGCVEWADGP